MEGHAVERETAATPSRVPRRDPDLTLSAAEEVLALQRSAGNRAVASALAAPPTRPLARQPRLTRSKRKPPRIKDVEKMWEEKYSEVYEKYPDCGSCARKMAQLLGGQWSPPPLMLKNDLEKAEPYEEEEARSRGLKVVDKIVTSPSADRPDQYVVYAGKPGRLTVAFYPVLPGMLVYTAESLAWRDRRKKLYRWWDRHMMMYAGGGIAYENFRDPNDPNPNNGPRNVSEDPIAYGSGSIFSVGLALYDPFEAQRGKAMVEEFIADMVGLGAIWPAALGKLIRQIW